VYVAAYDYVSDEPGDLVFTLGQVIEVTKSSGDWWTGRVDGREGIFPSAFVKLTCEPVVVQAPPQATPVNVASVQAANVQAATAAPAASPAAVTASTNNVGSSVSAAPPTGVTSARTDVEVCLIEYGCCIVAIV